VPASTSGPSPAQELSEIVTAHLPVVLLLMIFPLYFEKANVLVLSILFSILFLILIYHLPSVHLFFSLESCSVSKNVSEAQSIPSWSQAMQKEMMILE